MRLWLLLFVICGLSSCTRYIDIHTNTFADRTIIPQGFPYGCSFAILSEKDDSSMLNKEVKHKIGRILRDSGYALKDPSEADFHLYYTFDMESDTRIVHVPSYIPGPSETTKGRINSSKEGEVKYEETKESSGIVIYTPQEVTLFHRKLHVAVFDRHEEEVWEGQSMSTGAAADLRDTIDYLLVSAFNYFGENTKKDLSVRLDEKNPTIQWLKEERDDKFFSNERPYHPN